ncbi:MAG: HAD family hydrolase [Alphaproteobacteria bacterium]|nr:HAD family hydrolase [Alphaproteobacteria bacterium]MCD8520030.1 HAD family hydrolase [Alphaproteobacteria bacterium]MCD8526256.1 HAD family hydrolase [Alphaproteobacteria bacterium]MCD8570712.1 HAD family hydrolase [Alphaproteobacteria bacterium]
MTLQAPTVVIFDMDGTTVRHLNPFVLWLCENYDDMAYNISKFFGWIFHRKAQGPVIPEVDLDRDIRKHQRLLVHRAVHRLRRGSVDEIVEPCPGIINVLNILKFNAVPMALVSNGLGKGYGHDVLRTFELAHYYDAAIFREDISKAKPNPEPILLALREMGVKLKKDDVIWYVGDRHKDITAALNAAPHLPCTVVPVAVGMNAAVAAIEKGLGAEHIILSYKDMAERLTNLLKGRVPTKAVANDSASSARAQADKPRNLQAHGQ